MNIFGVRKWEIGKRERGRVKKDVVVESAVREGLPVRFCFREFP